jgi:DNA-binding transcriptional LysR family regulator
MTNLLLDDLMLFLTVVETKSFTAAADEWKVTKSVVSKRISRLEKQIGVQLLFRSTRKLSLSDTGERLYEHCQRIKHELEEAEMTLHQHKVTPHGVLRVNAPTSFSDLHLVGAVSAFMKKYPEVEVELLLGTLYEDLIESGIDCAFRIGEQPDSNLISKLIARRRMRVCASPEYLEKHSMPETPEDLRDHNCLLHRHSPTASTWVFNKKGKQSRIEVNGNFTASSSRSLEAAAVNGLGIVMLPGYVMTKDIQEKRLVSILEDYCPQNISIYVLYPNTSHLPPKVRAFIDFISQYFGDETYWS